MMTFAPLLSLGPLLLICRQLDQALLLGPLGLATLLLCQHLRPALRLLFGRLASLAAALLMAGLAAASGLLLQATDAEQAAALQPGLLLLALPALLPARLHADGLRQGLLFAGLALLLGSARGLADDASITALTLLTRPGTSLILLGLLLALPRLLKGPRP